MNLSLGNINNAVKTGLPSTLEIKDAVFLDSTNDGPAIYTAFLKSNAKSEEEKDNEFWNNKMNDNIRKLWTSGQLFVSIKTIRSE